MGLTTGEALALRVLGHRFPPGERFVAWRELGMAGRDNPVYLLPGGDRARLARLLARRGLLEDHGRGVFSVTDEGRAAYTAMPCYGAGGRASHAKGKPAPGASA